MVVNNQNAVCRITDCRPEDLPWMNKTVSKRSHSDLMTFDWNILGVQGHDPELLLLPFPSEASEALQTVLDSARWAADPRAFFVFALQLSDSESDLNTGKQPVDRIRRHAFADGLNLSGPSVGEFLQSDLCDKRVCIRQGFAPRRPDAIATSSAGEQVLKESLIQLPPSP